MVRQKPWVSQNFRRNLRVSRSHFFNGDARLPVSIVFTNLSGRIDFFHGLESREVPIRLYPIYELE